jgi:Na+-translocating ferredoxin:NAD+ oxidoreductase RnfG subunit
MQKTMMRYFNKKRYPWRAHTLVLLCLLVFPVLGQEPDEHLKWAGKIFPAMTDLGNFEGEPASATVFENQRVLGYVYYTDDVIPIPAYSGKPIRMMVGVDVAGIIKGVRIVHHEEPILVVGITEDDLARFIDQYTGSSITDKIKIGGRERDGYQVFDGISGATITVMVINASITRSLRDVAKSRDVMGATAAEATTPKISGEGRPTQAAASAVDEVLDQPVWLYVWQGRKLEIALLLLGLSVLLFILVFQDWLARKPAFLTYLRTGFLLYTLFFIGWYSLAQLSVVNVLTFVGSIIHGFSWENFLIDPMMFLLWGFVAMTLLLWGRGVYCGWLCPFGALQELLFRVGEYFKVRSFEFPEGVHQRLWAIKYLILLGLFGVSLQSLVEAEKLAEVEPFKTAITLRFQREWGFVIYAGGLLAISLFNRKFYCRYLCPLGAALTYPARFRIFDWLLRRKECGRPCQICAQECEVRAIRPTGEINPNECHYCLDCQVTYWNAYKCPPVVEKRKKRERHNIPKPPAEVDGHRPPLR